MAQFSSQLLVFIAAFVIPHQQTLENVTFALDFTQSETLSTTAADLSSTTGNIESSGNRSLTDNYGAEITTTAAEKVTNLPMSPGSGDSTDSHEVHPLVTRSQRLFLIVIPIITVVGLIGNALMFLVMQRPSQRRSPVSVFMCALAVADSIVLVLDFINNWINFVSSVHLKSSSLTFCRAYNFIFSTTFTYAAWLVVCVSVERLIVVRWPVKAETICTVRKAKLTVVVLPFLCGFLNVYHILIWRLDEDGRCDLDDQYQYFNQNVQAWLSAVFYSYLPVTILIVSNACIIAKLADARRSQKMIGAEKLETFQVTVTVVVICVLFIVLTVPLTLFYGIIFYLDEFTQRAPETELARTLILIFGLSNHAINFFLYTLTSARFQKELEAMFCGCREKTVSGNDVSMATSVTEPSTATTLSASTHM